LSVHRDTSFSDIESVVWMLAPMRGATRASAILPHPMKAILEYWFGESFFWMGVEGSVEKSRVLETRRDGNTILNENLVFVDAMR